MNRARKHYVANRQKVIDSSRKRDLANPEKTRERQRKYVAANLEKVRERSRKWAAANLEKTRATYRKYRGLPLPTRLMPELCERNCGRKATALDHCHITGKFRGWLCQRCNMGLGLLGDTLEDARHAVIYLEKSLA
jgi:Recombination endonuclease VII